MLQYFLHTWLQEPEKINKIMSSIQSISDKAIKCFDNQDLPRDALTKSLSVSYTF